METNRAAIVALYESKCIVTERPLAQIQPDAGFFIIFSFVSVMMILKTDLKGAALLIVQIKIDAWLSNLRQNKVMSTEVANYLEDQQVLKV